MSSPWLDGYRPWGVSVPFLEVQFLGEVGRLTVESEAFVTAVMELRTPH